jgi:hypothetical protein
LYGLKQAGRNWSILLASVLEECGMTRCVSDHCVYWMRNGKGEFVIVAVYVDDLLVVETAKDEFIELRRRLDEKFIMAYLGEPTKFLGATIAMRDGVVTISQELYIEGMMTRFGLTGEGVSTPALSNCRDVLTLKVATGADEDDEGDCGGEVGLFREIVGSLLWVMGLTRPDVGWIVGRLSQYLNKSTEVHMEAARRVLRYLHKTKGIPLRLRMQDDFCIIAYSDADWATDSVTRKSVTGYVVFVGEKGGFIAAKSKAQATQAMSSTEAEYVAASAAAQEVIYLAMFYDELGFKMTKMPVLRVDNQSAIAIMGSGGVSHARTKHIDLRIKMVNDLVEKKKMGVEYVPTADQVANTQTKPEGKDELERHRDHYLGWVELE